MPSARLLEGSVDVLIVLVTGNAVCHGIGLDPMGSGVYGEDWSVASSSSTENLHTATRLLGCILGDDG
jgi:hypothetical protein